MKLNIPKVSVNYLVILLLLLFSSTGFSFPVSSEKDAAPEHSFVLEADLKQDSVGLTEAFRSSWRIFSPEGNVFNKVQDFRLFKFRGMLSRNEYLRGSEAILPGLDVPAIIYPFHVFL